MVARTMEVVVRAARRSSAHVFLWCACNTLVSSTQFKINYCLAVLKQQTHEAQCSHSCDTMYINEASTIKKNN